VESEVHALREENARLRARVADLEALVERLCARIEILEKQLAGKPGGPPPAALERMPESAPKPRGRPKGHPGTSWSLPAVPPEVIELRLTDCPECGGPLSRWHDFQDHVVVDIPAAIAPLVTNYRHERRYCRRCRKTVRAPGVADEPPHGHLGLRLLALAAELKSGVGIPFTKISGLLQRLFQVRVPRSTLPALVGRVSQWLVPTHRALLRTIAAAPVKHADETSWPVDGKNGWAWAFATADAVAFVMEPTRGAIVPKTILGTPAAGVLVCDDYSAYRSLPHEQQACWAHLLNEAKVVAGVTHQPAAIRMRQHLRGIYAEAEIVAAARDTLSPRVLEQEIARIDALLVNACRGRSKVSEVTHLKKRVKRRRHALLTFLHRPGVEPTNNRGERVIRPLVLVRKVSGGSRSWDGARAHGILASCLQSLAHLKASFDDLVRNHVTLPHRRPPLLSILPT